MRAWLPARIHRLRRMSSLEESIGLRQAMPCGGWAFVAERGILGYCIGDYGDVPRLKRVLSLVSTGHWRISTGPPT